MYMSQLFLIPFLTAKYITKNKKTWQLPILPEGCPPSTFSVYGLNFQVRNVTGCTSVAIVTKLYNNNNIFFRFCQQKNERFTAHFFIQLH